MGRDSAGVPVMRMAREAPFTSGATACKRAESDISNHRTVLSVAMGCAALPPLARCCPFRRRYRP